VLTAKGKDERGDTYGIDRIVESLSANSWENLEMHTSKSAAVNPLVLEFERAFCGIEGEDDDSLQIASEKLKQARIAGLKMSDEDRRNMASSISSIFLEEL
jgi:hypothetical protein